MRECHSLVFGGVAREYLLHVPASYKAGGPLLIALHGVGEQAPGMMRRTGLSAMADTAGFALVYPNALLAKFSGVPEWNVFFSASFGDAPPDDIGFLRELVRVLKTELNPDPKRIYVVVCRTADSWRTALAWRWAT